MRDVDACASRLLLVQHVELVWPPDYGVICVWTPLDTSSVVSASGAHREQSAIFLCRMEKDPSEWAISA